MKADAAVQGAQDRSRCSRRGSTCAAPSWTCRATSSSARSMRRRTSLSLEEARRRLAQLEEDVKSRAATNQASLAVVGEAPNKAQLAMQRAQQIIDSLVMRAPIDGVVSLKENRDASGGFFFFGHGAAGVPRRAIQVWPGRPVADVIESGRMEVRAKVDETDRANLTTGQPAAVYVDALPGDRRSRRRVGALSGLASRANLFESSSINRHVRHHVAVRRARPAAEGRRRPRASSIEGKEVADALHVPRQAVFDKNGKNHVFVKIGDRFEQREVKVVQRTESRVAVSGLADGTEVALVDPTVAPRARRRASPASPMPAAGAPR